MRVVDSDFLPQIFPRFFILVRLSPLPHKSILVHSAQKNSHNFIVFAEMMKMEQKTVDFFSIKVYLKIKIWIQNQISKIINQKIAKHQVKKLGFSFTGYGRLERVRGFMIKAKRKTNLTNEEVER